MTVAVSGELYPCSKFLGLAGGSNETFRLGDVHTGITKLDVREEFVGLKAEEFTECIGCDAADYCTGGCPADNYNDRGSISRPAPFDCSIAKIHKRVLQRFEGMEKRVTGIPDPEAGEPLSSGWD